MGTWGITFPFPLNKSSLVLVSIVGIGGDMPLSLYPLVPSLLLQVQNFLIALLPVQCFYFLVGSPSCPKFIHDQTESTLMVPLEQNYNQLHV